VYFSISRYTHVPMGPFAPIREGMKYTDLHAKFSALPEWTAPLVPSQVPLAPSVVPGVYSPGARNRMQTCQDLQAHLLLPSHHRQFRACTRLVHERQTPSSVVPGVYSPGARNLLRSRPVFWSPSHHR
jgi:hypothetical protein